MKLKTFILTSAIWVAFTGLLFLLQIGLDGMALPENSMREWLNTLLFGLAALVLVHLLQSWKTFPPLFDTKWYLFHIVLSAFSYLVFDSIFVDMLVEPGSVFVLKESSLGSSYIDKVLGNGFSIYIIILLFFGLTHRKVNVTPPADAASDGAMSQIKVKLANRTYFVDTKEVLYIRAAQNYSELFTQDGKHVVRETLNALEGSLDQTLFLRIHRSAMINRQEALEFMSSPNGNYKVKLRNGEVLNIGNKFKKQVLNEFNV